MNIKSIHERIEGLCFSYDPEFHNYEYYTGYHNIIYKSLSIDSIDGLKFYLIDFRTIREAMTNLETSSLYENGVIDAISGIYRLLVKDIGNENT